ncbi:voltage-dependent calcium channel subunit alpha-2/delta-3 [Anoplophora glabripennis]|uniref:voltage-dependent calcium channel subunit alpha-2/delta-3 n=1 Tax=Anoplophora glabripennis TaxID=217634 RepID=UPI00087531BF|nr:voltage-dependent calcium channel subunit alpha-2/delta-3 [Anoplophora glabripennis]
MTLTEKNKSHHFCFRVRNWAQKLGGELWHFGELVTRKTKVKDSYKDTTVIVEKGDALLRNIHENISNMMKQKIEIVKRIAHEAEESAQDEKESKVTDDFQFYNAKNLKNSLENTSTEETTKESDLEPQELRYDDSFISANHLGGQYQAMVQPEEVDGYQQDQDQNQDSPEDSSAKEEKSEEPPEVSDGTKKDPQARETKKQDKSKLPLYRNRQFYNIPVNTNYSAVHVPSNVYERSTDVIFGIYWSEKLDHFFKNNYNNDPTLSWQYFCSSTGFMRQFPAMIWSQEPIDLFDCRTRSWYIEAAASPKDVVILVDRSGSMTGMRREIARHVVHNILDTLGNNDYVNIYTFSNTTDPLVECFDKKLVQANLANVRVLKESMTNFKTEQIANFSLALITAFELLQEYRENQKGANCSQAIMLVTDGVQYNYKEIFEKYNWGNLSDHMKAKARVFTYLIGREVSDVRDVKWMACANQGYYVHLSTYAEVREEVLHYIPVMARPMVLSAPRKPKATWSPVYADVTDPKLTNWLWVNRERNRQRERFLGFSKLRHLLSPDTIDKKFVHQQKTKQDNYGDTQTYHLMTSVSLPVYDKRPLQERVANLLGVAGLDVPIEYIQRLMMPYTLGVNGYAFLVTNNGYILTHPDLRPVYQGILKPAYNRVDMIEVEILDDENEPRDFDDVVKEFRRKVIMQETGNITLGVKSHIDDMRRIILMTRHYFYMGIEDTPFSLVIALPHKYGFNRVQHPVENDIHRIRSNDKIKGSLTQFFTGNWTIHPDWHYCRYLDDREYFENPEEEFLHFLRKMEGPGWKWTKECDRKLICKVVADAKITAWFNQNITTATKEENGAELVRKIGIVVAFMATHSGLTRWQNFPQNIENPEDEPNFRILHNKAIDEIWYKRAVEHHYVDPSNFVYSVPQEVGNESNILVTVSHAIFKEETSRKAPAAVVGYQFYHSALHSLFTKITTSCGDMACKRTCESEEIHCVLLDDNGFVIISDHLQETGYFFGKIRSDIMSYLVEEGIYKVTKMYDYQGLCPEKQDTSSPAAKFPSPIIHLSSILNWVAGTMLFFAQSVLGNHFESFSSDPGMYPDHHGRDHMYDEDHQYENDHMIHDDESADMPYGEKDFIQRYVIPKTKPEPCDHIIWLYSLVHYTERNISNSGYNKTMADCTRPYMVQRVSGSNMILLVINNLCKENENMRVSLPEPLQVDYNMSLACYRALNNDFPRRLYMSCIKSNSNESEIKLCGKATNISPLPVIPILLYTIFQVFI